MPHAEPRHAATPDAARPSSSRSASLLRASTGGISGRRSVTWQRGPWDSRGHNDRGDGDCRTPSSEPRHHRPDAGYSEITPASPLRPNGASPRHACVITALPASLEWFTHVRGSICWTSQNGQCYL